MSNFMTINWKIKLNDSFKNVLHGHKEKKFSLIKLNPKLKNLHITSGVNSL